MADLTCRLREAHRIPVYAVQSLALEALQVTVGVGTPAKEFPRVRCIASCPHHLSGLRSNLIDDERPELLVNSLPRLLHACGTTMHRATHQLYVPVSNALGLGSSFRELEELGYKTLFPQTFATLSLWHQNVRPLFLRLVHSRGCCELRPGAA